MSMKATQDQQRQLLQLQSFDSQLARVRTQLGDIRQDEQLTALRRDGSTAVAQAKQLRSQEAEQQAVATEAERLVTDTTARRDGMQKRVDRDDVSSRDIQAVTMEIAELTIRIAALEEDQLVAMQALEEAQAAVQHADAKIDEAQQAVNVRIGTLNERGQELSKVGKELTAERETLAKMLPGALVKEYEQIRDQNQGVGALELKADGLSGAGIPIAPVELAAIHNTPEDEVAFCPDTGAILVRG